jgi:hypothetical protein
MAHDTGIPPGFRKRRVGGTKGRQKGGKENKIFDASILIKVV